MRQLQDRCATLFVCGFSAGGLLALRLAAETQRAHNPAPLAGVIVLAPALNLRGGRLLHITGVLKHVTPWYCPLARGLLEPSGARRRA